jgi:hypothetical protein
MKTIIATVVGVISGGIAIWIFELIGHIIFPLNFDIDPTNLDEMKLLMFKIPVKSMIAVILAHVLGIIVGMYAATFVEKESFTPLYIVGGLLMLGSVLNLVAIPHPKWFAVTDILVSMIGIYGFLMFRKKA